MKEATTEKLQSMTVTAHLLELRKRIMLIVIGIIVCTVALALGLPASVLIGLMPATYAYFFIPNYPSDIATVNFDPTGTTKIGKYYFNHSFMFPGLVGVITA